MIPKKLHYIWLGNSKRELNERCIDSYFKYMSAFSIKEWNESNIDVSLFSDTLRKYYETYYDLKKYAFCSDIARLYILKNEGGIYVDTDVEFIKSLPEQFLECKGFICRNYPSQEICNGSLWGCEKDDKFVTACIRWFDENLLKFGKNYGNKWIFNKILNRFFTLFGYDKENKVTQNILNYIIYSTDYFNPKNFLSGELRINENTIAIHHYERSWRC